MVAPSRNFVQKLPALPRASLGRSLLPETTGCRALASLSMDSSRRSFVESSRFHPRVSTKHTSRFPIPQQHQRHFFTKKTTSAEQPNSLTILDEEEEKEFEDLVYIAQKRNVQLTVQKGTQAGFAAGLCIMGGIVVGGPVGALVGGIVGTAIAAKISKQVVSLQQMLKETPRGERRQVYKVFSEAIREEFQDGFQENPELKLLLGGGGILSVMRYCLDRNMIESENLEKLDRLLTRIRGKTKSLE